MSTIKGLTVDVYRNGQDCSAGGVTSSRDRMILVGPGIPEIFEVEEGDPYLVLDTISFRDKTHTHAKPKGHGMEGRRGMFGGNFIYTSDSRFPSDSPIKVHDRYEG